MRKSCWVLYHRLLLVGVDCPPPTVRANNQKPTARSMSVTRKLIRSALVYLVRDNEMTMNDKRSTLDVIHILIYTRYDVDDGIDFSFGKLKKAVVKTTSIQLTQDSFRCE
jgi:hypothetical protein